MKVRLEKQENIVKSVKFLPDLPFKPCFCRQNYFKLGNYQEHHKTQLLGKFCEISTGESEDMTWKTRKYREISEIFASFPILTMFLSIELLKTWQLSRTS